MTPSGSTARNAARVFVALALTEEVREALRAWLRELERHWTSPAFRWVRPEQAHITLKFVGAVERKALPEILGALARVGPAARPLELSAHGLGFFPDSRRPRVCWADLAGDAEGLRDLHRRVDEQMEPWSEKEERPWVPHLTLARIKEPPRDFSERLGRLPAPVKERRLGRWKVGTVDLMESALRSDGAIYTVLGRVNLGPGAAWELSSG